MGQDTATLRQAQAFGLLRAVPTSRVVSRALEPTESNVAGDNPDHNSCTTFQEWVADTNPTNEHSYFRIERIPSGPPVSVYFQSSSNRVYTLRSAADAAEGGWSHIPGQTDIPGTGALDALMDTNGAPMRFYRVGVRVP